jgi:hypothetical protein
MADYHPLIARAVAGLEKSTGEARRALYERARTALVAQLRGVVPPLDESEITRERLALEESIRKVEAEAARQSRFENRPSTVARPPRSATSAPQPKEEAPATETKPLDIASEPPAAEPAPPPSRPARAARPEPQPAPVEAQPEPRPDRPPPVDLDAALGQDRKEPRLDIPPRPAARSRTGERAPLSEEAVRGFRDSLDKPATPAPARPSRSSYVPPVAHDFDRLEAHDTPQIDPEAVEALRSSRPGEIESAPEAEARPSASRPTPPRPRPPQREMVDQDLPNDRHVRASKKGLVVPILAFLVFFGLIGAAFWYRAPIMAIIQAFTTPSASNQTARDTPPATTTPSARPKISDRIGPGGQEQGQPGGRNAPGVAQKVMLIEEEPGNPKGVEYVGSAIWRTETISPGPGQPPELAVKAEVEIPDRKMRMTWSIRRNTDKTLPASHTIEIMFNLPADFVHGGINNIPGILMKQADQQRGTPLAGLAVKVTTNFFLIGLSAVESDSQRNVQLLKERTTFDIPIVYNDNRRAILALDKGTPGDRAFEEAFAAWKQ